MGRKTTGAGTMGAENKKEPERELAAAVRLFWPDYEGTTERGASGWNNTTRFVARAGRRYVLRVYETHRDRSRIEFEQAVLRELAGLPLSFCTPVPVKTADGADIAELSDGRYACLFGYIEGVRPGDEDARIFRGLGEAAGELSAALARIRLPLKPAYRPYYELEAAYPLCAREAVEAFCARPPAELAEARAELNILAAAYGEIVGELEVLRRLPHQLVHGDLNASNVLVGGGAPGEIAALLDFEFCTYDVRAMEAAVVLSALPEPDASEAGEEWAETARSFCLGWQQSVPLTGEEIAALPLLMRLRKVDVFLHFLTRYLEGVEGPDALLKIVRPLCAELRTIENREREIKNFFN
ncbi:phosphotransferase [Saccharibacillus sp. CPCC 101409]|uniref:phosphotransferase n=1 Tax=Saccharibacillus sp. CPCC 101409 TaxID=3058041 RepID=UPI002672AB0C|nr:phosphotransferase [Saccharibacillus sp. CPCC 101409]MDO3411888.1 phosphotransferase [Saccharibacillus sp. CPCC 101409]